MRAVVKVMLKGEAAKKVASARDILRDLYGLSVSTKGRVVEGLAENVDDAALAYPEISEALFNGETEYIC